MRKILLPFCSFFFLTAFAQDEFSGISTSKRVGIVNALNNPSELANLKSQLELNFFGMSVNASSNKIGFSDLVDGNDFEKLLFSGNSPANFKLDAYIMGPGAAIKVLDWGFAITTGANIQANVVDVDPNLGLAVTTNDLLYATAVTGSKNQRVSATTWGEVGLSAARKIFSNEKHQLNGGLTLKLLFPGSYVNFGAGNFSGTINNTLGDFVLDNASANLNIAYSGSLASDFTNTSDYTKSLFGGLSGLATDFGIDYQLKNDDNSYRLKVGLALKNIGTMTFKSNDNHSTNYHLNIPDYVVPSDGLNLNQFDGSESIKDIENVLLASGYLNKTSPEKTDFKIKLPTTFNAYADVNIIPKLNATVFLRQKINDDNKNGQITSQNFFSVTPRFTIDYFEAYMPLSFNEISGTTLGLGFRVGGFFIGSNAVVTALTSDSNQADAYFGFRTSL